MITEFRRLIFSNDELRKAIEAFDREKAKKLAGREIKETTIVSDPRISLTVSFQPDEGDDGEVELDANYIAAAMLFYCSRCKIPIAKHATKVLEIEGDCLALSFSLNSSPQFVRWDTL